MKIKEVKLKATAGNKDAKGKTYKFKELDDGSLVPRDVNYPLIDAPGYHDATGGAKAKPVKEVKGVVK